MKFAWMKWNEKLKAIEKKISKLRKYSTDNFGSILNRYKDQNQRRRNK